MHTTCAPNPFMRVIRGCDVRLMQTPTGRQLLILLNVGRTYYSGNSDLPSHEYVTGWLRSVCDRDTDTFDRYQMLLTRE